MFRAALVSVLATGCMGDVPPTGGPRHDAAVGDGARADARSLQWIDAASGSASNLPCENLVSPAPDLGRHNTGKSCFDSCHNGNHGFTLAGTLYTNATGNTGFAGATLSFIDANDQMFDIVVNANGNFYTNRAIAFPVLVIASACPSAVKMEAAAATGNCNSCHVGGTSSQMHLP